MPPGPDRWLLVSRLFALLLCLFSVFLVALAVESKNNGGKLSPCLPDDSGLNASVAVVLSPKYGQAIS